VVSLRMPDPKHLWKWRWGAVIVGILLSGLTGLQQTRARASHLLETKALSDQLTIGSQRIENLKDLLATSSQRIEYMRGQLDSIALMVGRVESRSTDPGLSEVVKAIKEASIQAAKPLPDPGVKTVAVPPSPQPTPTPNIPIAETYMIDQTPIGNVAAYIGTSFFTERMFKPEDTVYVAVGASRLPSYNKVDSTQAERVKQALKSVKGVAIFSLDEGVALRAPGRNYIFSLVPRSSQTVYYFNRNSEPMVKTIQMTIASTLGIATTARYVETPRLPEPSLAEWFLRLSGLDIQIML
jgi:hypothetical protein